MYRLAYNLFLHAIAAPLMGLYYLPRVAAGRKYRRSLAGKLGHLPDDLAAELLRRPLIWFHAVSVGEVMALNPLVAAMRELMPAAGIVVSTGTETGQDKARGLISEADGFFYLPLDFPAFVNPVVKRLRPDLFVLMETELWPNLIYEVKRAGAVVALANGRISDRSFPGYMRLRRLFVPVLSQIDLFLMSSELDATRVQEMGGDPERVHVTGNTKFDIVPDTAGSQAAEQLRELLGLEGCERIWVAGSTHPGEHEIVLDAFTEIRRKFPDAVLVIVPRHVERTPAIIAAMLQRGMPLPYLRSSATNGEKRGGRRVIVVDTTGELFQVYSLASVVFVGGSLVPKGGQNIVEPAAWGKVVLFGPSMEDFRDARDLLARSGAGIVVSNARDLAARVEEFLSDPHRASAIGERGREAMLRNVGSATRNAGILVSHLSRESKERRGHPGGSRNPGS
jgi:3-deoxy-D-manno-octulosonic-acid transferase